MEGFKQVYPEEEKKEYDNTIEGKLWKFTSEFANDIMNFLFRDIFRIGKKKILSKKVYNLVYIPIFMLGMFYTLNFFVKRAFEMSEISEVPYYVYIVLLILSFIFTLNLMYSFPQNDEL